LLPEDVAPAAIDLWECHALAVSLFGDMGTQWRTGAHGPTGLDYNALPPVLRIRGIARSEWADVFDDLRTLEMAALEQIFEDTE
jgi:hypothetical protein